MSDQVHLHADALVPSVADFTGDAARVLGLSAAETAETLGPMMTGGVDQFAATIAALLAPVPNGTAATAAAGGEHAAHIAAAAHTTISILTASDQANAAQITAAGGGAV